MYYFVPRNIWNLIARIKNSIDKKRFLEKNKSFGSLNTNLKFYVIRRRPPAAGFFSNISFVCQGLLYASEKGYKPIVDMENYWVHELSSLRTINNTKNAWCYFFEQTSEFSLSEVYKSKNVILSNASAPISDNHWLSTKSAKPEITFRNIRILKNIIENYIFVNKKTQEFIEKTQLELELDTDQTLGVFIRGVVYDNAMAGSYFDIPSLDFILAQIKFMITRNNLNRIFVVTESFPLYKKICEYFRNEITISNLRYHSGLSELEWLQNESKLVNKDGGINMGYDRTLKYLTEMSLLSSCKYFIGTYSNATLYSLARSDLSTGEHRIVLKEKILDINEYYLRNAD
jgi:hypothetical protein